jgi:hypothetical protein
MKPYTAADFQSAMQGHDPRREELAYLQERLGPAADLLVQSQPLLGTVLTEQGPMEVSEALAAFAVGTVVHRFGTWVVTEDGVACLVHHYPLTHARLNERQDWASHLAEQSWVNLWDALRALSVAQHTAGRGQRGGPYGDAAHPS